MDVVEIRVPGRPARRTAPVRCALGGDKAGASPVRWLVGFKLRSLIPASDDGKIGKGGDLFVEVNTTTRQVVTAKGGH